MILKGSNVKILTGKDKNKEGEVIEINISEFRAKVKGMNIIKKHVKTTKEKKGGIFDKENFINLSNLALIDNENKTKKEKIEKIIIGKPFKLNNKIETILSSFSESDAHHDLTSA